MLFLVSPISCFCCFRLLVSEVFLVAKIRLKDINSNPYPEHASFFYISNRTIHLYKCSDLTILIIVGSEEQFYFQLSCKICIQPKH